jgi:hypothetical protein
MQTTPTLGLVRPQYISWLASDLSVQKVNILTCHSAKGLEWPVVFIPEGKSLIVQIDFSSIDFQARSGGWCVPASPIRRHRRRKVSLNINSCCNQLSIVDFLQEIALRRLHSCTVPVILDSP